MITVQTVNYCCFYCQQDLGCKAYEKLAMTYMKFHALLLCDTFLQRLLEGVHMRIACRPAVRDVEVTTRCTIEEDLTVH